jgi:hypothetical protein
MKSFEKETSIWFNDGEDECYILTYNKSWQSKLQKAGAEIHKERKSVDGDIALEFIVPKKWIRIRPPAKRSFNEAQRMAAGDRLKSYHKRNSNYKESDSNLNENQ